MKIMLKNKQNGFLIEFENKKELQNFVKKYIEKNNIIENEKQEKILNNKNVTIFELLEEVKGTYQKIK